MNALSEYKIFSRAWLWGGEPEKEQIITREEARKLLAGGGVL